MDAKAHITGADLNGRLRSRHVAEGFERALPFAALMVSLSGPDLPSDPTDAALHLPASANEVEEIFKKTPYARSLKLAGRYLAKDIDEVGSIPLLMKTLLDNGHLNGDCITVTGRTITENLKSVKPITVTAGVVGLTGNLAPEGAIVEVAGMLQDGGIEISGEARTANVKLSAFEHAEHETKWQARATNQTLGALWKYARDVGPAVDGAVIHPCGAHEKQCYADI
jgi:dihydroxyacid dehydratase/phosphogluconate dehydratase